MLGLLTKDKPLVKVDEAPAVIAVCERLMAARKELEQWEAEELRLKRILDPLPDSSAYTNPPVTREDIREARARLKADLGCTIPSSFYLMETRAARQVCEDLQLEAQRARDQAHTELCEAVRERASRLVKDFQTAFQPCQDLAQELLKLQEDTGVNFQQIHSCLPCSNVANELAAVRLFANG